MKNLHIQPEAEEQEKLDSSKAHQKIGLSLSKWAELSILLFTRKFGFFLGQKAQGLGPKQWTQQGLEPKHVGIHVTKAHVQVHVL